MKLAMTIGLILLVFSSLSAQDFDAIREADVQLQGEFIDASREKILGNYDKALAAYKAIVKKDRENDAAHYELARVLAKLDRVDEAQKSIERAIEFNGSNIWYQFFQADLYERNSDDRRAAGVYAKLIKRYPDNSDYYYKQAYYLVRARDLTDAIGVYDALEKRIGLTEEIVRRKHSLYLGSGDVKKASKELQRLVTAFPNKLEYLHLLAGFYQQTGQADKAKSTYKRILEIDATDAKAKLALEGGKRKNNNALMPIFEDAEVPIDLKVKQLLPYINQLVDGDKSDLETSLDLAKTLTRVHPQEAKSFAAYGDLLYHSGELKNAQTQYERTLELNENIYPVWEQLMYIHSELGQYAALAKVSEDAIDIFPNQARVYYMNAFAQNAKGEHEDAIEMLEEAQLMVGKDVPLQFEVYAQLGAAHYNLKDYEAAKQAVEAALKLNSQAYPLVERYGDILFQLGDAVAAVEQWRKAKKLGAKSADLERKIADQKM